MATTNPPALVSTDKAAAALGVDRVTLWRWYKNGTAKPAVVTPGKHLRWNLDDLRAQLANQAEETG